MSNRRAFSVQSKLLAAFVLLTIAGIAVLTGVGYLMARQSLTSSAERQLTSLQRSKAGTVKAMLTSMRNEVLAVSASDSITAAALTMRAAHRVYERLGFVRAPERDWQPMPGIDLLVYRLDLTQP